ncbi:MAG: ribosomal RNA small subunit methyltransferase A, partial [Puniceicoccaceae bacterium]
MPLSPTSTRERLQQLEHFPNKKLGQNFLVDGNIVRKSIQLAEIGPGSVVVEIGPGLGTLTQAILTSGASLWAVERDPTLAEHLRVQLLPEPPGGQTPEAPTEPRRPQADTPPSQAANRSV